MGNPKRQIEDLQWCCPIVLFFFGKGEPLYNRRQTDAPLFFSHGHCRSKNSALRTLPHPPYRCPEPPTLLCLLTPQLSARETHVKCFLWCILPRDVRTLTLSPTNHFSIKPLKVKLSAGEQKATESSFGFLSQVNLKTAYRASDSQMGVELPNTTPPNAWFHLAGSSLFLPRDGSSFSPTRLHRSSLLPWSFRGTPLEVTRFSMEPKTVPPGDSSMCLFRGSCKNRSEESHID